MRKKKNKMWHVVTVPSDLSDYICVYVFFRRCLRKYSKSRGCFFLIKDTRGASKTHIPTMFDRIKLTFRLYSIKFNTRGRGGGDLWLGPGKIRMECIGTFWIPVQNEYFKFDTGTNYRLSRRYVPTRLSAIATSIRYLLDC